MNRDRLLADAKARALAWPRATGRRARRPLAVPAPTGRAALALARRRPRAPGQGDAARPRRRAGARRGADRRRTPTSRDGDGEDSSPRSSARPSCACSSEPATLARMEHMLDTGKPLRN
jgi:3-hydroxyacyl-CoA dehydrogenase